MKRAVFAVLSVFFGCIFWFAFDAERMPHETFTFDKRTVLGLIAWCSVAASISAGRYAFSSKER